MGMESSSDSEKPLLLKVGLEPMGEVYWLDVGLPFFGVSKTVSSSFHKCSLGVHHRITATTPVVPATLIAHPAGVLSGHSKPV